MLQRAWYTGAWWLVLLRPLSLFFTFIAQRRRIKLQAEAPQIASPVVIVGNISVGGSGKTPLLLALIDICQRNNLRVGVISRGYGGEASRYPLIVDSQTDPSECGDEPAMIAQRTAIPVVVDPDRVRAAQTLLERTELDLILSDDGLQHYRLQRSLEIAVVDAARGLGNGRTLPEGPLREPTARLEEVDLVVLNGEGGFNYPGAIRYRLKPRLLRNLKTAQQIAPSAQALGATEVDAIAGIGHPQRFFDTLGKLGFNVHGTALADHAAIDEALLAPFAGKTLLMTEKDAVKCGAFANDNCWALCVDAVFDSADEERLTAALLAVVEPRSGEINGS